MDARLAADVAENVLTELKRKSYAELKKFVGRQITREMDGPNGKVQIEIQTFWDKGSAGDLRVMCSVDDGGLRAFKPITRDFVIRPDGSFVGE